MSLEGKYATQLTTSKHFYDMTAHRYIQDNCQDMGLKYIRGLLADMDDLLKTEGQANARAFFEFACMSMEEDLYEAFALVGGNYLAGVVTDGRDPDREIDRLAKTLCYALERRYAPPANFYGVGGMKVFRDLIWIMQGMMKADHRFYKAHGQYDFPQKQWRTMLKMQLVGMLLASPKLKGKMGREMTKGMLAPCQKVLDSVKVSE